MKINVVYAADGRILALSPLARSLERGATVAVLRSGPEPVDGQRLAVVDLDITVHSLREIHRRYLAVEAGAGVQLVERTPASSPPSDSSDVSKDRGRRVSRTRSRRR